MTLEKDVEKTIRDAVRKLKTRPEWKTTYKAVREYRKAILLAQNWRCAYCARPIYRDEVGFRELDHVLPKARQPSKDGDFARAPHSSNLLADRRNTAGYADFRYVPENLVIACKRCNAYKGTFDGLKDRTKPVNSYPDKSAEFEWVHPYFDEYFVHIEIVEGVLYKPVNKSSKGEAVIHACGLDKAEELSARVADSYVHHYSELKTAILAAVFGKDKDNLPLAWLAANLHARYQIGTEQAILDCMNDLIATLKSDIDKVGDVVNSMGQRLGATGTIPPA